MTVASDYVEIDESALDLLAWSVSNEVINGFKILEFEKTIGATEQEFRLIAVALRGLPQGTRAGFEFNKARIFRNALAVVLNELGVGEFAVRTGHDREEGRTILELLSGFVERHGGDGTDAD
jgi:hypothetical protein